MGLEDPIAEHFPVICSVAMEAVTWSRPAQDLALNEGDVHIWLSWLDVETRELTRLRSYLNSEEVLRAERFVFPRDRDHFIVARGRLRELLGRYLHCPPNAVQFKTGRYGKLLLFDDGDRLRFNLSHSHGLAIYGICMGRDIGIDTEKIRSGFAGEEIAQRYFSAPEQQELAEVPEEIRDTAFFLCWTRKEAYIKAHGDGLQIPLDSFDVSLTPGQPERLRSTDCDRWSMRSFIPAPEFVAAIVVEGEIRSMHFWGAGD
ncbi:MAG TPA: 4'-phosphopantetheinyl transferase superfamily protein [Candidatus Acidoferrum sp.]|nr:4'-phosphopantetheinyl transferase superfamily protein [Candidatus Acidoferrum sp.]